MQKHKICGLLTVFILLTAISFAGVPEYVYVAGTFVRIRDKASTTGKIVATIPIGSWGKVLEVSSKPEKLLGKDDPVCNRLEKTIGACKNAYREIESFIEKGKAIEEFD